IVPGFNTALAASQSVGHRYKADHRCTGLLSAALVCLMCDSIKYSTSPALKLQPARRATLPEIRETSFTSYMRSPVGDIYNPDHNRVNQDMRQPLCNYYIASSHNTYLMGDQLMSQSRVDMYAWVLQAGCRCVEVDCWDGPDGEPIVHHGYTLTSKILFRDVIETINKYAFAKTDYPVILSIENHCSVPQQKAMARHLCEVLGDKLDLTSVSTDDPSGCLAGGAGKGVSISVTCVLFFTPAHTPAVSCSWQVSSFSEAKTHQLLLQKPHHYLRFNQWQLSRIYPSSYRVDSSNFNPQPFWNAGCQLVALNYQSEGRVLQLNRAKFNTNGNCGYVLKPKFMTEGTFNPTAEEPLPTQSKKQLVLRIISGQQLPKPKDSMLGDRGEVSARNSLIIINIILHSGFNPMWEETLVFTMHMPEIALVRFLVWDHDPIGRDFIGQRTLAFTSNIGCSVHSNVCGTLLRAKN
uniref:Phosphoinositide phospholipase C n=1 Tax=Callorhinchus milii TaxID=7868 RepID=A0A4W3HHA1_CALMI